MQITRPKVRFRPALVLHSQVSGRERWHVGAIEDRPRLAAAIELVLRSEEGILDARANPLTGRVLVYYRPGRLSEPIETLLHRALGFGAMSREEFSGIQSSRPGNPFRHLLAAEIGCTALKVISLGGYCPLALGAAVLLLFMHRRSEHGFPEARILLDAAGIEAD